MNYLEINAEIWAKHVEEGYVWSVPVSSQEIENAKKGIWEVVLTPQKPVPRKWFPDTLQGKKVLRIAGGGGQQGPILAAAGADVTVFDNSEKQLEQDRMVAMRENLPIKTVQGNMQDLSVFQDETFDLFFNPVSNCYIEDILPTWLFVR